MSTSAHSALHEQFPLEHGPREGETIVFVHGGSSGAWTWIGVVENLPGRHTLTPDLPGYGERYREAWRGLDGAADDLAALLRERALSGRAHVVGLSLGGFVAMHLLHRHPQLVHSCTIRGSALLGYSRRERMLVGPQVPLWHRRWYWAAQAPLFRIPADARDLFVTTAVRPSPASNRAMFDEVAGHALPPDGYAFDGLVLAVAAEHDSPSIQRAFAPLRAALPQTRTWVAPGVHHPWSAEDPALFARMVAAQADGREWPEQGLALQGWRRREPERLPSAAARAGCQRGAGRARCSPPCTLMVSRPRPSRSR